MRQKFTSFLFQQVKSSRTSFLLGRQHLSTLIIFHTSVLFGLNWNCIGFLGHYDTALSKTYGWKMRIFMADI